MDLPIFFHLLNFLKASVIPHVIIMLRIAIKSKLLKGRYKTGGTGQLYDGFPDCEWKMNTP
jgi:hypothetical protein